MRLRDYIKMKAAFLASAGIEDAEDEAACCIMAVTGLRRSNLHVSASDAVSDVFSSDVIARLDEVFERRASHEPLAYIVGSAPFYDLDFDVGEGVLIPRFDTETLVEAALHSLGVPLDFPPRIHIPMVTPASDPVRIFDLCTGSGCIGITIADMLKRYDIPCHLVMTEISPEAAAYALKNAKRILGSETNKDASWSLEVVDLWPQKDAEKADIIVSNPPYIAQEEMATLAEEVALHEPSLALTDGGDGLSLYRRIVKELPEHLAPGGVLMVEHGYKQKDEVTAIFNSRLENVEGISDYGENDRVTFGTLPK